MNTPPNLGAPRTPAAAQLPPPAPAVSAALLALASTLRWVPRYSGSGNTPALGGFRSLSRSGEWTLALVADDRRAVDGIGNRCAWVLDDDCEVDPSCLRFLVSLQTAHVLQEGELHETGAITWQKRHYRIEARRGFNGIGRPELIAEAVPW